jgi:hypothetical protein
MTVERDSSFYPAKLAVLNTDTIQGTTLVPIKIDPITKGIETDTTSTISFTMHPVTPADSNYVRCWLFQGTDGLLYPAVANSSGKLLIEQ